MIFPVIRVSEIILFGLQDQIKEDKTAARISGTQCSKSRFEGRLRTINRDWQNLLYGGSLHQAININLQHLAVINIIIHYNTEFPPNIH